MDVLLVEDEPALADVVVRNLRARGHTVRHAGTVETAVLSMAEAWPEALILDINLPDQTGWDILRRMTEAERAAMRVIVISAAPISQKRIDEFKPSVALTKPFPIDALVRALATADTAHAPGGESET